MTADDKRAREARQREEDLRDLLKLPAGRRLLWWLIEERAGVSGSSYSGADTHRAAYVEGQRSIGRELSALIQDVAPSDYVNMVKEAVSRREDERLARERDRGR